MDRVVPVAVKAMPLEAYRRQLRIGDGDATRVLAAVEFRPNAESGPTVRRANEAHDRGQVDEWGAAPIHRDVREHPMLDLVPLARTRRKVTDRDHQARPIGQTLQFPLPQPEARPVAPACSRAPRFLWTAFCEKENELCPRENSTRLRPRREPGGRPQRPQPRGRSSARGGGPRDEKSPWSSRSSRGNHSRASVVAMA